MEGTPSSRIVLRDATRADVDALTVLRPPRGLHVDRVPAATGGDHDKRYVLAEVDGRPAGFGVIYFRGDPMWQRPERVPLVMDLWVAPHLRGRGIGRSIVDSLEQSARVRGFPCVYLQVQAEKNPRVVRMYERLGYQKLQARPYTDFFAEVDEHGDVRAGEELILDMRKWL
jgi:ribosomal protein S18 acetylase RimI-like enzyme